jgi:hypothetical protein
MILAYAGRRVDAAPKFGDTAEERFPAGNIIRVADQVHSFLSQSMPSSVVGSAACGADLLVLEAAGRLAIRRRVILPFDRGTFRVKSVIDRPGDWGPRFDEVIDDVRSRGDLIELPEHPDSADAFLRANAMIFREAERLARDSRDRCTALVIWNGLSRGAGDVTDAFASEARGRGWPITQIDTSVTTSD